MAGISNIIEAFIKNLLEDAQGTIEIQRNELAEYFECAPSQINYVIKEKWNISLMLDLPLYQNFRGTQLASNYGLSLNFARDFNLQRQN